MITSKSANSQKSALSQNSTLIIAIIVVAAVVVAVVAVLLLNNRPTASAETYVGVPHSRTEDGGFVIGDPEAPVTIIEFADFACPHCQDYQPTMARFVEEFVKTGKAKFEYRMFISGADPVWGRYTAQVAECAAEQEDGAFWPTHDVLFELGSRGRFNQETAKMVADRVGLDYAELLSCAGEATQVDTDVQLGVNLGVQSTPTMMVRLGDADPQFINFQGRQFDRGPVDYEVLRGVVEGNQ